MTTEIKTINDVKKLMIGDELQFANKPYMVIELTQGIPNLVIPYINGKSEGRPLSEKTKDIHMDRLSGEPFEKLKTVTKIKVIGKDNKTITFAVNYNAVSKDTKDLWTEYIAYFREMANRTRNLVEIHKACREMIVSKMMLEYSGLSVKEGPVSISTDKLNKLTSSWNDRTKDRLQAFLNHEAA